jgi:hypothetical protein
MSHCIRLSKPYMSHPLPLLSSSVSENFCSKGNCKYQALRAISAASLQEVMRLITASYPNLQTGDYRSISHVTELTFNK